MRLSEQQGSWGSQVCALDGGPGVRPPKVLISGSRQSPKDELYTHSFMRSFIQQPFPECLSGGRARQTTNTHRREDGGCHPPWKGTEEVGGEFL